MLLFETLQKVDFSAVGSTNLMPLDIRSAVLKDKLSFLIFSSLSESRCVPDLSYSEFRHSKTFRPEGCAWDAGLFFTVQKGKKQYGVSLDDPKCLVFTEISNEYLKHKFVSIKSDASFEEISLFDATRTIEDCEEQQRIEELLTYFNLLGNIGNVDDSGNGTYSPFKTPFRPQRFSDIIQKAKKSNIVGFNSFQRELAQWYRSGVPRWCKIFHADKNEIGQDNTEQIYSVLPTPIFYEPLGMMAYDICYYHSEPQTRLQRLFLNDGCGLREVLVPSSYYIAGERWYSVMAPTSKQEKIPLWNHERIMSKATDTVVICGCIQDAEALQRANADFENVAFAGIMGDELERVNFAPLSGKNVAFLISNHNGGSLEDAYEETEKVFIYIRDRIEAKEYAFYQRKVNYPDSTSTIATPEALASAYYHHSPEVEPDSMLLPMDEYEFNTMLAKIRQKAEPFWIKPASTSDMLESRVDDFLVRGILYKGMTTLFAGRSGTKKTHFALILGRYVVAGDKPFLKDRFWTRAQPNGYPKKVVYWCFDDVSERELKKMNYFYKKNLPPKCADNFFIESAPEAVLNPDIKNIQKEMVKYAFKGQLGLPVELLIIDTLSDLKGQQHTVDSLKLLSDFKKLVRPDLAILVLHHITDVGNIRGGSGVKRGPRIALSLKKDKDKPDVFNLTYADSTNISLAPEEKKTFSFVFDDLEVKVIDPEFKRKEMRQLLTDYYRTKDYMKYTNDEVGILLGYSARTIQGKTDGKAQTKDTNSRNTTEASTSGEAPSNIADNTQKASGSGSKRKKARPRKEVSPDEGTREETPSKRKKRSKK